ncbi:hypothetical protein V1517DRAFT_368506 [Lipomyces orientalis]|uniref:Uncharacterized protein n=1 Tax=Lipomyces orientalis TaxID=1233043 RepID=A0ACC3TK71_9ASCO
MSVIGDLDDFGSAARGRQSLHQQETVSNAAFIPAKKTTKTVTKAILCTETRVAVEKIVPMEQSALMSVIRQVPTTWEEYEYAQEHLDNEENKFLRLWYDSSSKIATVVAAPTPLHSDMVGELMGNLSDACIDVMRRSGVCETIREGLIRSSSTTKRKNTDDGLTIREWDGAISYAFNGDETLMVAFEVGVSQTSKSLRAAISWCYYKTSQEQSAALQQARDRLRLQSLQHPFGPLEWNGFTWFGKLRKVIIETFRNDDLNCPAGTILEPSHSFVSHEFTMPIGGHGRFAGEDVPPNLREVVLGDCVPSHVLSDDEIVTTPLDFFGGAGLKRKSVARF